MTTHAQCTHAPDHPKWRTCLKCRNAAIGAGVRAAAVRGGRIRGRWYAVTKEYGFDPINGPRFDYRVVFAHSSHAARRLAVRSWRRALRDPQFARRLGDARTGQSLRDDPDSHPFAGLTVTVLHREDIDP